MSLFKPLAKMSSSGLHGFAELSWSPLCKNMTSLPLPGGPEMYLAGACPDGLAVMLPESCSWGRLPDVSFWGSDKALSTLSCSLACLPMDDGGVRGKPFCGTAPEEVEWPEWSDAVPVAAFS